MNDEHYPSQRRQHMHQVGHGLGGVLASLFRSALPFLRTGLRSGIKYMGKKSVTAGAQTLNDIIDGEAPKIALKRNFHRMKNNVAQEFKRKLVGGGGSTRGRSRKRIKLCNKKINNKKRKKRSTGKSKRNNNNNNKKKNVRSCRRSQKNKNKRTKRRSNSRKSCLNKKDGCSPVIKRSLLY